MKKMNRIQVSFMLKYNGERNIDGITADNKELLSDCMPEGQICELIADPIIAELDSDSLLMVISACMRMLAKKHGTERAIDIMSQVSQGKIGNCPVSIEEQSEEQAIKTWVDEHMAFDKECNDILYEYCDQNNEDEEYEYEDCEDCEIQDIIEEGDVDEILMKIEEFKALIKQLELAIEEKEDLNEDGTENYE